jgi:hypothetical protein
LDDRLARSRALENFEPVQFLAMRTQALRVLHAFAANLSAPDDDGTTPALIAAENGNIEVGLDVLGGGPGGHF